VQTFVGINKRPFVLIESLLDNILYILPLQAVHDQPVAFLLVLGQELDRNQPPRVLEVVIEQRQLHLELILDHKLNTALLDPEALELIRQLRQRQPTLNDPVQIGVGGRQARLVHLLRRQDAAFYASGQAVVGARVQHVHRGRDREGRQAGVDELDLGQVVQEVGGVDEDEGLLVEERQDVRDVYVRRLEELDEGVDAHEEQAGLAGEGDYFDLALFVRGCLEHVGHDHELVVGALDGAVQDERQRDELLRLLLCQTVRVHVRDRHSGVVIFTGYWFVRLEKNPCKCKCLRT